MDQCTRLNVLSEITSAEPTNLALPVGSRHHTARPATVLDISGHDEGISCCSGGVGCDVRAVSQQYSDNRPGHKKYFMRTTKTKPGSNESCKEGGASFGDACVCAGDGCPTIGSSKIGGNERDR